jgi:hypothetical protein
MLGETVGSYRITARVSEGGMGAIYRAEHTLIGRVAAVKVLLPELTTNRDVVDRFFNEAKATTAVRHPGIVEIYDFGYLPSGLAYLIMELLDGETLTQRLARRGRLGEAEAAGFMRGIAGALSAAHAKGIIHRDLKPDNIFLVPDPDMPGGERPKLLDFGIAKLMAPGGAPSTKTRTGALLGTPTYMSPEQCRGSGAMIDHRSDLYALGCILYELVCGRPPFVGEGFGEIIGAHLHVQPDSPRQWEPGLSATMEGLILRLLQKRPEERVQSAAELANALVAFGLGGGGGQRAGSVAGWADATTMMPPVADPPAPAPGPGAGPGPRTQTTLGGAVQTVAMSTVGGDGDRDGARRGRGGWIAGALVVAIAAIGGGVFAMRGGGGGGEAAPAAAAGAATATAPGSGPTPPSPRPEPGANPGPAAPAPAQAPAPTAEAALAPEEKATVSVKPDRPPKRKAKPVKPKPPASPIETDL